MVVGITTLVSSKELTGLGKYIVHLIEGLQKIESEHEFVIFVNKDYDEKIEIFNHRFRKVVVNIPHNPRIVMRPIFFLWHNLWFGFLLRKHKIDLLHLPNSIPLFNMWNIPTVVTIHDAGEYTVKKYTQMRQFLRKVASETSSKRVNRIITVSEFSKQEISKFLHVNPDKISVTYPGLTLKFNKKVRTEVLTQNIPFFLHVGGNRLNKNLVNVTEAFLNIKSNIEVGLITIGKGDTHLMSRYKLHEYEKRGVYFKGYISDKEFLTLNRNALALIFPSIHEGFGLPITEAIACGTPVITSNITSMPEVGGDAAHYVDPYCVDSIREGMEKLLNDEKYRNSLIKKGLERYKKFSWEEAAKKTIEVYERAIKNE